MEENNYMMWLTRTEGMTYHKISILLSYFKTSKEVWNAPKEAFTHLNLRAITPDNVKNLFQSKYFLEKWVAELREKKIQYISIEQEQYPYLLKNIYHPPFGIYVKGSFLHSKQRLVAVVGARRCSEYGKLHARKFGKELAQYGVTVISGMARGIDAAAQRGALSVDGQTIAVFGCGLDICYPVEHQKLMEEIIEHGCILSEYPPQMPPIPSNFPQRNRIIAGLSEGVFVVEAGKRSGSLITAQCALEENRSVFMMPGNIDSPLSIGTNEFIKTCPASVVTQVEDILQELNISTDRQENKKILEKIKFELEPDEKKLYDCMSLNPISMEELIKLGNNTVKNLQYILAMLEMKGYIERLPGQRYVKTI